jgi:hypothetical protein
MMFPLYVGHILTSSALLKHDEIKIKRKINLQLCMGVKVLYPNLSIQYKMRVLENSVLRRICAPKGHEGTG